MDKLTVRDVEVVGKRVLVRVDFNVPMDEKSGKITDDTRIRATLPTIRYLIERKARVILASHLGRPKGKVSDKYRLTAPARALSQLLGQDVKLAPDCIGPRAQEMVTRLKGGEVLLLENLRFHPEEEAGADSFAREMANLADVYLNDAFGASHRAHASITGVPKFLPAAAGFLLEKEVDTLTSLLKNPAHPFAALLGGAKVSDKVGMMQNIMGKVDVFLIGGAMAATFLKAHRFEVGQSMLEADRVDFAMKLMDEASRRGIRFVLPIDVMVSREINPESPVKAVAVEQIPADMKIVDIGPRSVELYSGELRKCRTVFWNGPMGIYEIPAFARGTRDLAKVLSEIRGATIIGGGSTAEAVTEMGLAGKMTFVSTGGGASLEFLSGDVLPGVAALRDNK